MTDGAVAAARAYYRALDEHDYDALAALLAPGFVHDRPDLILEGRGRFVAFMRDERPDTETSHELTNLYEAETGVAAEGTLRRASGDMMFSFVDTFRFDGDVVRAVTTYTHSG